MLEGSCHCGAVRITIPRKPRLLKSCNCSVCRRYGALWAYYPSRAVRVRAARGATGSYAWGDRTIRFVRCRTCGCVTHWELTRRTAAARMGVNMRMFDPALVGAIRVRLRRRGDPEIPRPMSGAVMAERMMTMPGPGGSDRGVVRA